MFLRASFFVPLALIINSVMAGTAQLPSIRLPVTPIASLPNKPTFLENIARRPNGDFVVTQHEYQATVHLLKNPGSRSCDDDNEKAELIPLHTFPEASGLIGITNLQDNDDDDDDGADTFIFTSQRFHAFLDPIPNTTEIWEMKFLNRSSDDFTLRKVSHIPQAGLLNGMAQVPPPPPPSSHSPSSHHNHNPSLIIADSLKGQLLHLDITTGTHSIVLDNIPELLAPEGSPFPTGVNGLKIRFEEEVDKEGGGWEGEGQYYVYWSNTVTATFYRIPLYSLLVPSSSSSSSSSTKTQKEKEEAKKEIEKIIHIPSLQAVDDFSFDKEGNLWGVASVQNVVFVVYRDNKWGEEEGREAKYRFVAGALNSTAVPGPTAVIWGDDEGKYGDGNVLYVTHTGGSKAPVVVDGTEVVIPAGVVGVDTRGFF